jgi:restriction system protein
LAKIRLPEYLRTIDPREFEELICRLFERMGYQVTRTPYAGDGGVDAYMRRDGCLSILQCKRVRGSVGEPILRDLFGTMHAETASSAFVVTTGKISRQARAWIKEKPIFLMELPELHQLLQKHFTETDVVPHDFSPTTTSDQLCPRCGSFLHVVRGRRGQFVGCKAYPKCLYTRDLRRRRG